LLDLFILTINTGYPLQVTKNKTKSLLDLFILTKNENRGNKNAEKSSANELINAKLSSVMKKDMK